MLCSVSLGRDGVLRCALLFAQSTELQYHYIKRTTPKCIKKIIGCKTVIGGETCTFEAIIKYDDKSIKIVREEASWSISGKNYAWFEDGSSIMETEEVSK